MAFVTATQARSGWREGAVLQALGIPPRSYRRWKAALAAILDGAAPGTPEATTGATRRERGRPSEAPPTPQEQWVVQEFARRHPALGYKRLTWLLLEQGVAALRPYQVLEILRASDLLARRPAPAPAALKRPAPPERPDQVWHLDLMYLRVGPRWFYLVDILDGYSRYLVHWSLNPTMLAETVTLTLQEALERLEREGRRVPGEPQLVHDHGSQFVSQEWKGFVAAVGTRDVPTRVAHPESNGKVERLHRTHREEGLAGEALEDYHAALRALARWASYYNAERPHSALKYLAPAVYYRGNPEAKLEERARRLETAAVRRRAYWEGRPP